MCRNRSFALLLLVSALVVAGHDVLLARPEPPPGTVTLLLSGDVELSLIRIPAGEFLMGSPESERGRSKDEGPVHRVEIGYEFHMGRYPVTQSQWEAVMGSNPAKRYGIGPDYPVYYVSWDDCQEFLRRLNRLGKGYFRLPSEAEWEYAARAGTRSRYFFGDSLEADDECEYTAQSENPKRSDYLWYCGNNSPAGTPGYSAKRVGSKLPNPFGLFDMSGNLWEWCLDAYYPDYTGAPADGSARQGPPGSPRVLRGGAWDYYARHCRSASRNGYEASRAYTFHGLRLVWFPFEKYSEEWFAGWEARLIADNILSYQNDLGSWPKNMNMETHGYLGEKFTKNWGTSIDNGATVKEMKFLAGVIRAQGGRRFMDSFDKGLGYLLKMQYSNGGWPQRFPPGSDYGDYITYNDDAMLNVMELMRDIAREPEGYSFVREPGRERARRAFERGLRCILASQVRVDSRRTAWAAQHDPVTLAPRAARGFEPVGLASAESAALVLFLMEIPDPSSEVVDAVNGACRWFEETRIAGKRQVVENGLKRLVDDQDAPPLWARFYEIETSRPIFSGMDGTVIYSLEELDPERIMGYRWYVEDGGQVLEACSGWRTRIPSR